MSGDRVPVHLNREDLHAVEVPDAFETTGSFDISLYNHGSSVHVHLHLDDALSEVATIDAANHFIDGESERAVRVSVDGSGPVRGKLKVASAYGAQTRYVDVEVQEPEEEQRTVQVDESLAQPQPDRREPTEESSSSSVGSLVDNSELVVLALAVAAVLVAAAAAVVIDNVLVLAGALVVLVGVLVAAYFLVAGS